MNPMLGADIPTTLSVRPAADPVLAAADGIPGSSTHFGLLIFKNLSGGFETVLRTRALCLVVNNKCKINLLSLCLAKDSAVNTYGGVAI
jgi:hypothetical protein